MTSVQSFTTRVALLSVLSIEGCAYHRAPDLAPGDRIEITLADPWASSSRFDWSELDVPAGEPCGGVDVLAPGSVIVVEINQPMASVGLDGNGDDCWTATGFVRSDVGLVFQDPPSDRVGLGNAVQVNERFDCRGMVCDARWRLGLYIATQQDFLQPLMDGEPARVAVTREVVRATACRDSWAAEVRLLD